VCISAGGSHDLKRVLEALEPINKVLKNICSEKLSETRCASTITRDDLRDVRKAFRIILHIKDAENFDSVKQEEFLRVRHVMIAFVVKAHL